jgi:anti-sigma regulatory factor (Ser/Thr protein kinase)
MNPRRTNIRDRLSLTLPAADHSGIGRARGAVTELCERVGVSEKQLDGIRLAVSEACTNCVLHAYDGHAVSSSYCLHAHVDGELLVVVVEDAGAGMAGDGDTAEASRNAGMGMGLPLIRQSAARVRVTTARGVGTRLEMEFPIR